LAKRSFENPELPLRRIVKCAKCGWGLTGAYSRGEHGGRYPYYWCSHKCNYKSIPVKDVENALIIAMKTVEPTKERLDIFIAFLYKTYHQRLARLTKIRNDADAEIEQLKVLRKVLVEKNLSGVYSDEVFKEQSAMIEDKITRSQIVKNDTTIDKYNIDAVTSFIKTLLADLGEAYRRSNIKQLKVLLGSMYPSGVAWDYSGTLNPQISPLYQYIKTFSGQSVPSGAIVPNGSNIF